MSIQFGTEGNNNMKRPIFFLLLMMLVFASQNAWAQAYGYGYGYRQPGYGYNYGSYRAPAYGSGAYNGYATPSYYYRGNSYRPPAPPPAYAPRPPQVGTGFGSDSFLAAPNYQDFIRKHTKDDYGDHPPVEIWLGMRVGRIGDYWFEALGGSSSHPTPKGTYTVKAKHEDFYSRKYEAEMPYSVFFTEQCAIHEGSLRVRSHGCIHVGPEAARKIFAYSKVGNSKVKVHK